MHVTLPTLSHSQRSTQGVCRSRSEDHEYFVLDFTDRNQDKADHVSIFGHATQVVNLKPATSRWGFERCVSPVKYFNSYPDLIFLELARFPKASIIQKAANIAEALCCKNALTISPASRPRWCGKLSRFCIGI
jgi:hypothetical protein